MLKISSAVHANISERTALNISFTGWGTEPDWGENLERPVLFQWLHLDRSTTEKDSSDLAEVTGLTEQQIISKEAVYVK